MNTNIDYFWFRLFRTSGIGPKNLVAIARILNRMNLTPDTIPLSRNELTLNYPELAKIIIGKIRQEDREMIYQEYQELEREGINIIYPDHSYYPQNFLDYSEEYGISPVLFCKGQLGLINQNGIAIVGSRNVSEKGVKAARRISADLANHGINVISGYAKGVDSEAHLGALQAEGTTTLVLSYGIKEFRAKKEFSGVNWERDVLAVSQFSPNTRWIARNAMLRNKLVCALSHGVVVIESGLEKNESGKMSGTFDAGKTALKMGLPLFVVTPKYFDIKPQGNCDLIKQGGIEINPENDAIDIIQYIKKDKKKIKINQAKSLSLQTELFSLSSLAKQNLHE